ncbi:hypothetical protein ECANGB1_2233 [Enterospora canceri]|uniref:Plus3 domain-containing protein n=1 Tax=Enterospora canceri TaxID=1081671 RepID=A0A1Y1S9H3_9MICR|nr:hypothetical protein ECANGB1_2233 [Enterospora canceri]
MTREFEDKFKLTAEEDDMIRRMTPLEQEKYKARRHEEIQAEIDAERIKKANEENKSVFSSKPSEEIAVIKDDMNPIQQEFVLGRDTLIKGVFRSNFNLIKGLFVRVRINNTYRAGKILGVEEIPSYKLPKKKNQKDVYCNIGLTIDAGKRVINQWPIVNVSNSSLRQEEFETFVEEYSVTRELFAGILRKTKKAKEELTRNLTDLEITDYLNRKARANPRKESTTLLKMRLIKRRDNAIQRKNKKEAEEAQRELEEIEDQEYLERFKNIHDKEVLDQWMEKRREASVTSVKKLGEKEVEK